MACSCGLNTSAAISWLDNKYEMGVIALTVDIHGVGKQPAIWQETLKIGAVKVLTLDGREMFGLRERFARAEASKLFYRSSCQINRGVVEKWLTISETGAF